MRGVCVWTGWLPLVPLFIRKLGIVKHGGTTLGYRQIFISLRVIRLDQLQRLEYIFFYGWRTVNKNHIVELAKQIKIKISLPRFLFILSFCSTQVISDFSSVYCNTWNLGSYSLICFKEIYMYTYMRMCDFKFRQWHNQWMKNNMAAPSHLALNTW